MRYKLLVFDLDGTLLNPEHQIGEGIPGLLEAASRKGISYTIASGRVYASLEPYLKLLKVELPVIVSNGAVLRDGRQIYFEHSLSRDTALATMTSLPPAYREKIDVYVFYGNDIYTPHTSGWADNYSNILGIPINKTVSIEQEVEGRDKGPTMMVYIMGEELVPEVASIFKGLGLRGITVTSSNPYFVDILPEKAGKGKALQILTAMLGLEKEEVIAFGDGLNDIELLKAAGIGVAVANAPEEVKKHADYVTAGERHEGVVEFLEKVVLRKK